MKHLINKVNQMDAMDLLKQIPDKSIDLTVTSPPYDNLRDYKGYTFEFNKIAKELHRVTKIGGIVVWIVGDQTINGSETGTSFKQALYFKEMGFNLHDTMIYSKNNYVPLNHNRYEQQFEYMFIFSNNKPKTFNPIKIKCKYSGVTATRVGTCAGIKEKNHAVRGGFERTTTIKNEKIKSNIWGYDVGGNKSSKDKIAFQHPAIFPEKIASDHIISWSNKKDIVLDPFMGSWTTAKIARILNRNFIGCDISEEYCEIGKQRLRQQTLL